MKYKVGDKVRIKSLDWYNENKDKDDNVPLIETTNSDYNFIEVMRGFCGKVMTIFSVNGYYYDMLEDDGDYYWTDEMIERLAERNGKTYPYKIGDRVVLKGNNRCATITDLKYNSWGNLSYYIRIDNDKDISVDYPTDLLLPYDNKIEAPVEGETKPKMVNLDDVCEWIEKHIFDFPWYDNEQGDFSSKDVADALRKAMEE